MLSLNLDTGSTLGFDCTLIHFKDAAAILISVARPMVAVLRSEAVCFVRRAEVVAATAVAKVLR